jgi:hypothetical protein
MGIARQLLVIGLLGICHAAGASVSTATDARRCSLRPPPPETGFDPVGVAAYAQVIVRARADSSAPHAGPRGPGPQSLVYLTVIEVIDSGGLALPAPLTLVGQLTDKSDFNSEAVPYRWTRHDGLTGACFAYTYQRGGEYLLLLRGTTPESLTPYWAPLAPTNEQVRGATDPWVEWVRANHHRSSDGRGGV